MPMGPVDYAVLEFPGTQMSGSVLPALVELVQKGVVRIIDLLVVQKDAEGNVKAFELDELPPDKSSVFAGLEAEVYDLFNEDDIQKLAQDLAPNTTGAMIVWENVWAARLQEGIKKANGRLVKYERVPAGVVEAAMQAAQAGALPAE